MTMNVIEASGLGKRYGGTWALHDCTLAIPAGHVAALVGPNGAGKSTLLNLATGLAAPSAGGVTVQCLNQHGYTQWTSYQPDSRFWPFQWIEGGWLLVLSALLIAATVWLIRRRAA
jgi:ABC-type multidrug transport system ATPase subunit